MITAARTTFEGPLTSTDSDAIAALRDVLARHGFAGEAGNNALGAALAVNKSHLRDDLPLYLRRLAAPTPLNTLAKLFMLDRWVDEKDAAEAVRPLELDQLRSMGLIEDGPSGIRARVRLSAHDGLIIAHDGYDEERRKLRPDHVLDVNPTTMTLANMTVRRRVGRALEIGTGCGVLALKAAGHADHVVATDTNPRALNLAVFNAALNGITNVEWRQASLFDAVAGERFDLIFCNPPYVISPDSQFIFRDGGRRGDALCEEIVRRLPEHLRDGGFATVLINWVIRAGEHWSDPLRRWVDGNGCDTWLMMSAAQEPLAYAALWNRSRDRAAYEAGLDRWSAYFEQLAAQTIGLGAVVLRRRASGTPWTRADHMAESVTAPGGRAHRAPVRCRNRPRGDWRRHGAARAARRGGARSSAAPDAGGSRCRLRRRNGGGPPAERPAGARVRGCVHDPVTGSAATDAARLAKLPRRLRPLRAPTCRDSRPPAPALRAG